jgi:hypothetical protein
VHLVRSKCGQLLQPGTYAVKGTRGRLRLSAGAQNPYLESSANLTRPKFLGVNDERGPRKEDTVEMEPQILVNDLFDPIKARHGCRHQGAHARSAQHCLRPPNACDRELVARCHSPLNFARRSRGTPAGRERPGLPSPQRDPPMSVRVRVPACNAHFLKCRRRRRPAA